MHNVDYVTHLTVNIESISFYANFQPPVITAVLSSGVKPPGREDNHSASSTAEVMNALGYYFHLPTRAQLSTRDNLTLHAFILISVVPCCRSYESSAMEQVPHGVGDGGAVPRSDGESSDPGRDHGSHHRTAAVLPVRMRLLPIFKCSDASR